MKGIILAGGTGSRLWPLTISTSKQLLSIFDKPLVYYPLATLMSSGIRDISLITTPHDQMSFKNLLGDGSEIGISLTYVSQPKPEGLAQAFILCEEQIKNDKCALILGDNLFDVDFGNTAQIFDQSGEGAQIFAYKVNNPEDYGVVVFDSNNRVSKIVEKPVEFISEYAVPGIYFYDHTVAERAKSLTPSKRGELEITDLHATYLESNNLTVSKMEAGSVWLDTGSFQSMNDASQYVRIIEERKGHKIGCIEEIAWKSGWIDDNQLLLLAKKYGKSSYGTYLESLIKN
jgi:glucose-1-phosphate thymidylyltransferase